MPCEFASVEEDVHEHDRYELAGFAEDHGGVGYVGEGGEAEGGGGGYEEGALEVAQEEGGGGVAFCGGGVVVS